MRDLSAVVQQVALHLGPPWKFNHLRRPSDWRFEIIDGRGRSLVFCHRQGRFNVGGSFLRDRTSPHKGDFKSIGVSPARPPKDIAADVKRRLLPHYLEAFERATRRREEELAAARRLDWIARALMKVTGGHKAAYEHRAARAVHFEKGTARVWVSGSVELELRGLSPEEAVQILAFARSKAADSG
jgi:hypothetical protein